MAPRPTALVLLTLLTLPALAMAGPGDVCAPVPDCAIASAAEAADPAVQVAGTLQAAAEPTVHLAAHYARLLLAPAVPDSGDSILLAGPGVMTVRLGGNSQMCEGEPRLVLEASRKSFGLEPSVTFTYGGGRGEGGLLAPCARGQTRQPVRDDITGAFEGAWSATKTLSDYTWRIDVGAPQPDGSRSVSYWYESADGTRHTFDGLVAEYR